MKTLQIRLWMLLKRVGWFYGLALAACSAALWTFMEVAEEAIEQETVAFNSAILMTVHRYSNPFGDAWALASAAIGSVWGIAAVGIAFGFWLYRQGRLLDLIALGATLSGGAVLTFVLKTAYHLKRPDLFPRLVNETTYSFPSGHASMSTCLYGFIAVWLVAQEPRELWRWFAGGLSLAFAMMIGLSRLYLGVHWPTDVIGGMVLATFWLGTCLIARQWLSKRQGNADQGSV